MSDKKKVLAMYDVRGIQKYIFRTPKVKDAIGASAIVDRIILEALEDAIIKLKKEEKNRILKVNLEWIADAGTEYEHALPFVEDDLDVQVLFIGGGNAFVFFESEELCISINKKMAKYILDHTYSLQLAVAFVEKTDSYSADYIKLQNKMTQTKDNMVVSDPLGILPIMQMEIQTGFPITNEEGSTETRLKKRSGDLVQKAVSSQEEKIFDNYIRKKGLDSMIAVVHIDGNSMAIRIRNLIQNIDDYVEAANKMREISLYITHAYTSVMQKVKEKYNSKTIEGKDNPYFIRSIVTAGDDITFVCNANVALDAVNDFCQMISGYTMNGQNDADSIRDFGFSVCAGIAYIGSHFPFSIGYDVAEACCDSAKDCAKKAMHTEMDGNGNPRIGNYVDYQICKNIQCHNLDQIRNDEYQTALGEQLLRRPFYIQTEHEGKLGELTKQWTLNDLITAITYFQNESNIPRSFAKKIRNLYPLGENQIRIFQHFLESRQWKMPDGEMDMYIKDGNVHIAKWYDALELMDCYINTKE